MTTQTELLLLLTRFADVLDAGPTARANAAPDPDLESPRFSHRVAHRRTADRRDRVIRSADPPADLRRPYLNARQVESLYEAATFLGQETGCLLNVQVELDHGITGLSEGSESGAATADFTRRARRILHRRGQLDFPFLYVHEIDARGHRVTLLAAHVWPGRCLGRFQVWAQEEFVTTAGRVAPKVRIAACASMALADRTAFHARALQQLLRGADPDVLDLDETGRRRPLVDLLAVPDRERRPIGLIDCAQRFGTSDSLAEEARESAAAGGMGFLSALRDRAWPWLYRGWEVDEHRERLDERGAREAERARIDALFPVGPNTLVRAQRAASLAQLDARCGLPAELRSRSRLDWWGVLAPSEPR